MLINDESMTQVAGLLNRIENFTLESISENMLVNKPEKPMLVWTINLSHLREISSLDINIKTLENNTILVADGWPVKYLARKLVSRDVNRITGVDLVKNLLGKAIEFGVIGSTANQVQESVRRNIKNIPSNARFIYDTQINLNSYGQLIEIEQILVKQSTSFTFIALGFPKQEVLFEKMFRGNLLTPGYYFGIGGSFQILSGQKRRAPGFVQKIGFEWFWRLAQDPLRLIKRYIPDGIFLLRVLVTILVSRVESS